MLDLVRLESYTNQNSPLFIADRFGELTDDDIRPGDEPIDKGPTQPASEVKPENISSKGSGFAKKLTNPGNNLEVTYKGRKFRNAEHAYQTYKSGEFDQKAYNSTAFKPIGSKPANKNTNYQTMVNILKAKLGQHPELIEGINQRGGLAYIEQSTHNVTGDKFWESKGQNKFIEALADAYKATQPTAEVITETIIPGVEVKRNTLSNEEQFELFNILKPYIEQQGAKTNKAKSANVMIGLGLRWDYKSNNLNYKAIEIKDIIVPSSKTKYGYYEVSINGEPLGPISPRIKELITKATGIDATNYDGAIINLYKDDTFISTHNDVDEAADAIKYPVLVANIGGSGNFSVERVGKKPVKLNAGDSYVFGLDGVNRKVFHRTFPSKQDGFLPEITTQLDGQTYPAGSYRISITMRRVKNLKAGMPKAPAKVLTPESVTLSAADYIQLDMFENQNTLINKNGGTIDAADKSCS